MGSKGVGLYALIVVSTGVFGAAVAVLVLRIALGVATS
jgi:hypothetical protein